MILLDEPSMGLAPQIVEEIFEIVKDLNQKRAGELPAGRAEHHGRAALRRFRLHPGERPRGDGRRSQGAGINEDVKEFYLGLSSAPAEELPRRQALPPPQALAFLRWPCAPQYFVARELVCQVHTVPTRASSCGAPWPSRRLPNPGAIVGRLTPEIRTNDTPFWPPLCPRI
jgi:hypothetical protein